MGFFVNGNFKSPALPRDGPSSLSAGCHSCGAYTSKQLICLFSCPSPSQMLFCRCLSLLQDAQRQPHSLWVFIFSLGLSLPGTYPRSTLPPSPWPGGLQGVYVLGKAVTPMLHSSCSKRYPKHAEKNRQARPGATCLHKH